MAAEVNLVKVREMTDKIAAGIQNTKLRNMFNNCFYSTIETTTNTMRTVRPMFLPGISRLCGCAIQARR